MNSKQATRPDVQKVLQGLKDFQRDTVNYVFRRLYTDPNPVSRFLIADEVGLGKTLVARGIIASVVDRLWDDVERIDVVYICSNQEIAQQNLDRLNIAQDRTFQHASRATLLPIKMDKLGSNKLNFISLTPGTSFNLRSQTGWDWERAVLFNMLRKTWPVSEASLSNILRGDVRPDRWKVRLEEFQKYENIDPELEKTFITSLQQRPDLRKQYEDLAIEINPRRKNLNQSMRANRNSFIGELRRLLAKTSLAALEPDLIILDEFQRFKYLLDEDNEFALLAQELFNYQDATGRQAKVLLLSATPYKMYTMQGEKEDNHYDDFLRTIKFLLNGHENELDHLKMAISQYRSAFLNWNLGTNCHQEMRAAKGQIEAILHKVMVRTERLAVSQNRNGMLTESCIAQDQLLSSDLAAFVHLDQIAGQLGVEDQIEYWKSSAYPLNLMEGYKIKRKFQDAYGHAQENGLYDLLEKAESSLLRWDDIQKYREIDPGNARLRALMDQTLESGNWQLLWLPPNLPYYHPEGPFTKIADLGNTKTLVFSAWRVVPKVIAVLLSYEAERRIVANQKELDFDYDQLTRKHNSLLRFAISKERKSGMSVFTLIYPCLTLAKEIDPLIIAKKSDANHLMSVFFMLEEVKLKLRPLVWRAFASIDINENGPVDESWYWVAPLLLDRYFNRPAVEAWLNTTDQNLDWASMLKPGSDEDEESGFFDHIREFSNFLHPKIQLGRQPKDLLDVLARIALASPAITTLRAMMRVTRQENASPSFLAAAAQAGLGFRTLFNQSDTITLLQSFSNELSDEDKVYWRSVLIYNLQGNLQAVLDEYVHVLNESLGLKDHEADDSALKLGATLKQALSIRSPSLQFDEIKLHGLHKSVSVDEHRIRCRYSLRFGAEKNDAYDAVSRDNDVRIAFNSPFRPFVLATTSIGQEGLDFHQYCHRVVHWNLPTNPVDLEQREGRVHRYKGHVVRRNLAEQYGLKPVILESHHLIDPWEQLFELARKTRLKSDNDLVPYWVYEGGKYKIERLVPVLPLSREINRLEQLKKSLVTYRSVIGQPRQQELLDVLNTQLTMGELQVINNDFRIDLSPPVLDKSP